MGDYRVLTMPNVAVALLDVTESIQGRYLRALDVLASQPELGREYLPENGDDELPLPCRVFALPGSTKSIYYHVDHDERTIRVLGLIDQRRNPAYRFRDVKRDDGFTQ